MPDDVPPTMKFASAGSDAKVTEDALAEVLSDLDAQSLSAADLAVVFATGHHRERLDEVFTQLRDRFGVTVVLGCTAEAVIGQRVEWEGRAGLSVLIGRLPGVTLEAFTLDRQSGPEFAEDGRALREAVTTHAEDGTLRGVVLLVDPFSMPLVNLMPAWSAALPGVPVVGGLASGGRASGHNRLLLNDQVRRDGAVGVVVGGEVEMRTTLSQGCRPIGRPMVITKAKRHVVQELGGINALQAVRQMASELDKPEQLLVQTKGLHVGRVIDEYKQRFGQGDFLIRGLVGVDGEAGFIAIGDPQVRVGQTIQFHGRDKTTAESDMALMLEAQKLHGPGAGALLFNCNSRGKALFEQPNVDANAIDEALGPMPLAGLFAAGEIGPVGQASFVHGHTASLAVFRPLPDQTASS